MRISLEVSGPTFGRIIADTVRDLRTANRKAGREIAKVGAAAIRKGAPRMMGRKLGVKTKTNAFPYGAQVLFLGKPAGAWAIADSGAQPHQIKPRRARALAFDGRFAMRVAHPGTRGHKAWVAAGDRLEAALTPEIEDVYEEALGG